MTKPKAPGRCPLEGCDNTRLPGKGKRFCKEHSTPDAQAERRRALYRQKVGPKAKPTPASDSIKATLARIRSKEQVQEGMHIRQMPGQKADQGKLQADLILGDFPRALTAIIEVGQHGNATKYEPGSWLKLDGGVQRVRNAAFRHWLNARRGLNRDPESNLLTLAHEAWNKLAELELVLRAEEGA